MAAAASSYERGLATAGSIEVKLRPDGLPALAHAGG
jgi:hypothetical protein